MSDRYFIRIRGEVQGPFDEHRLQTLVRRGRFSRSHEVSVDDGSTWSRASEFPDLFPLPPALKVRQSGAAETNRDSPSTADARDDALQSGPFLFSEIKRLADEGALRPDDLVWSEGMPGWLEAASVPGLLAASSPARRGRPWWIVSIVVATLLAGIAWLLRSFR